MTFRLPLEDTMKCSRIAHGFGSGSVTVSVADPRPPHSGLTKLQGSPPNFFWETNGVTAITACWLQHEHTEK